MSRDWKATIAEMTLDEKASLTNGVDFWNLAAVERLGIPSIQVTDGPNGARGSALFGLGSETSVCIPVRLRARRDLGPRADRAGRRRCSARRRTPRRAACCSRRRSTSTARRSAGRNFECYSEDPLLSGATAAAFVRGVQSQGVVTTVKHFAGNDAEFERNTINSVIDARTLRELYLVPFELAVRDGGALGVMTAYNRLNGPHCSEHVELLSEILRGEWGFEGFVLTDWMSAGSTVGSSTAGVDLEMPGPGSFFGTHLGRRRRGRRRRRTWSTPRSTHLLQVFERIGALDDPPERASTSVDRPEHRALAREAAAAAMVLLQNDGVLPFDRSVDPLRSRCSARTRERPQMMGGGSANLRAALPDQPARRAPRRARRRGRRRATSAGVDIDRSTAPAVDAAVRRSTTSPGATTRASRSRPARYRDGTAASWSTRHRPGSTPTTSRSAPPARYTPDETGAHTFTLVQLGGRARVLVDGEVVLDGVADPPGRVTEFFGMGSAELEATVELVAASRSTWSSSSRSADGVLPRAA